MGTRDTITVPPPDEIRRRIDAARRELFELRRSLRLSISLQRAEQARMDRLDAEEGGSRGN